MTNAKKELHTRETILALLSDEEVAKVSRAEGEAKLIEGDRYVDLAHVDLGVQEVQAKSHATPKTALPESAVSDASWAKILKALG